MKRFIARLLVCALAWMQVGISVPFLNNVAQAATCFWVGGTGSYSTSNTASWASGTGGTGGTCAATGGIPKQSADTPTFDGASGGGVVTFDSTISGLTLAGLTGGAFTGTLDFSVNNPSITFATGSFNLSGIGARKILLGTGTFTYSSNNGNMFDLTTTTNLDVGSVFNGATHVYSAPSNINPQNFATGGKAMGTLQIVGRSNGSRVPVNGGGSFVAVTLNGQGGVAFNSNTTVTTLTANGTSKSAPVLLLATTGSVTLTVSSASISNAGLYGIVFSGAAVNATNSFDFGGNNMNGGSIASPSGGGGGQCIGC